MRVKEAGASGVANAGCTDARGADAPACAREHACWGGRVVGDLFLEGCQRGLGDIC